MEESTCLGRYEIEDRKREGVEGAEEKREEEGPRLSLLTRIENYIDETNPLS